MASQTDREASRARWSGPYADRLPRSLDRCFSGESDFSADDLAQIPSQTSEPEAWIRDLSAEARRRVHQHEPGPVGGLLALADHKADRRLAATARDSSCAGAPVPLE